MKEGGQQNTDDYKKFNPMGFVPALEIDGHILSESLPICEYLEEVHGEKGVRLLPTGPENSYKRF